MAFFTGLATAGGLLYISARVYKTRQQKQTLAQLLTETPHQPTETNSDLLLVDSTDTPSQITVSRQQQLEVISTNKDYQLEQKANQRLTIATVNVAIAAGGLLYPPLFLATIPMIGYLVWPTYQDAYQSFRTKGKIGISFLDAVFVSGALLGRFFFALSCGAWFIQFSHNLLIKTEHNSREKLTNIFGDQPRFVWVLRDGVEVELPFEQLTKEDVVVVYAGQTIPVDGTIVAGNVTIDQHALTGESQPVEKAVGDTVMAATHVIAGQMQVQVEKTGEETIVAQLGKILDNTSEFSEMLQSRGYRIAEGAVLPTLALSVVGLPLVGPSGSLALLTASFGYNLRVVSPITMLNFLQIASEQGVLVKDGRSLERLSQIDTLVFDKTGTLTLEQPTVGNIYTCNDFSTETLLQYAATAEKKQSHPIAKAILQAAREHDVSLITVDDSKYDIGYGVTVFLNQQQVRVGSRRFIEMHTIAIPPNIEQAQILGDEDGYSLVYVAVDKRLAGAIELRPTVRPEATSIIEKMKSRNIDMFIISGDHERPTRRLAQDLGIDNYFAETLPENKADLVAQLQQEGRNVCFVGDGINDAIALKKADVSISLLGATTAATDTAQIIFMDKSLNALLFLFDFGDDFKKNMDRSLMTTIVPGVICVGGVFLFHFGIFAAIGLFNAGLVSGIINANLPKLRYDHNWQSNNFDIAPPLLRKIDDQQPTQNNTAFGNE